MALSLKDEKNAPLGSSSTNAEQSDVNTRSPSPLLDVGVLPSDDSSLCPYCGKQYRKVICAKR